MDRDGRYSKDFGRVEQSDRMLAVGDIILIGAILVFILMLGFSLLVGIMSDSVTKDLAMITVNPVETSTSSIKIS